MISEQLIDQEAIFIDGTKIKVHANKFTFVWRKSVEQYQTQLEEKSRASYQNLLEKEIIPAIRKESEELLTKKEVTNIVQQLERVINEQTIAIEQEPTGSKRKQLRSLRKEPKLFLKHFHSHQERIKKYATHYALLGDRNRYSNTSPFSNHFTGTILRFTTIPCCRR
ncbi:hypothetical protein LI951_13255 [Enterococcus sp. BWT-B8]|nr:hypothetical protein [Enterococcus sp. BWT-B8]